MQKVKILLYFSIIYSFFCLLFDYLVTKSIEKNYGNKFYAFEQNILVKNTGNINMIFLTLIILSLSYILYLVINYLILRRKKSYLIPDCGFISEFILIGSCHLLGGLSWFYAGWI